MAAIPLFSRPSVEAGRHIQPCGWVVSVEDGLGVGAPIS